MKDKKAGPTQPAISRSQTSPQAGESKEIAPEKTQKRSTDLLPWVQAVGPLIISWPMVLLVFLFFFKGPLSNIIDAFTKTPGSKAELGSFKIELGPTVLPPQYRTTEKEGSEEKIDLSSSIGKIGDTGPEGTTVGFTVAYALQSAYYLKRNEAIVFSPRSIYVNAQKYDEWPGENYEGTSLEGALTAIKKQGTYLEKDWPYINKIQPLNPKGVQYKISDYSKLNGIEDILNALRSNKVVMASINVTKDFDSPDSGRVKIKLPLEFGGAKTIAITGYDSDTAEFIFANDWGTAWGVKGFGIMRDTDLSKILINAYVLELP